LAFGGGGSASAELTAHTHNAALSGDGGDLSETLTDMNGVALYSLITGISEVPTGVIMMWAGILANIPAGYNLCDGTNGTPNLIAKFIRSVATDATEPGSTGGADSITLTGAESGLVSHTHTSSLTDPGHGHDFKADTGAGSSGNYSASGGGSMSGYVLDNTTGITVGVNSVVAADASSSHQNMPAYYELAYIQKS
tara:strand:+ start:559 stop:1146 length:588 start_codon:yes stop_codon:yes gene_type:complete